MSNKQPVPQPSADTQPASESEPSTDKRLPVPVVPATKRFRVVVTLFCIWLAFLVYLAFLTWSGK